MRADIHDGQERCSTKGRIHVRKTNLTISHASCDARPVHTNGSGTAFKRDFVRVRFRFPLRKSGLLPRSL